MRNIAFGKPIIGDEEKRAVAEVLESPILVHGPKSKEFEQKFSEFTGAPFSISVASCTAGLHLAYFTKNIGVGDEVIVPAETHTATVHAVEFVGAKPVFVDAEKETGNIDIDQIESHITPATKAISIVHFLGVPVAMDKVMAIAEKHNLYVVEDCALAIGTRYKGKHAGLFGNLGAYSFYPVKHMTTAEGGMVTTTDKELAERLTRQKAFGVDRTVGERKIPGVYDVTMLGYNYRMNEIEAAIGVEQVKRLAGFLEKREKNFITLRDALDDVDEVYVLGDVSGDFQSSRYCLSVVFDDKLGAKRPELINAMKEEGVGTSVYYPKPVPLFTYYKEKYSHNDGDFPVADSISNNSIALPVGPHLNEDDMVYVAKVLKTAISKVK